MPTRPACSLLIIATAGLLSLAASAPSARADTTPHPGMLRQPAVSSSSIAFIYANQVWAAPREGGVASLVAAPPVRPALPRFSPDGRVIAFMANFDGNSDLYTVPAAGGELTRVTHNPADETLCGWRDDTHLLFFARSLTESGPARIVRLYSVPSTGGLPEKLPMPYAGFGAVSHDGRTVAFAPLSTDERTWRRYRGGMQSDLWTMDLAAAAEGRPGSAKRITDWEGTDTMPMWGFGGAASTVYYLSDNGPEHRLNIWSYDTSTSGREQVTRFADVDVRFPSIGPGAAGAPGRGEIVFQLGARLMLLDLDSRESRAVSITIPGARPRIRERLVDAAELITHADLSPTGKRALLTARGDVWSVPAKDGPTRNLTRTDGVFERDGAWSPDGRWIAYFSDAGGEYELCIRASDAKPAALLALAAAVDGAAAAKRAGTDLDATAEQPPEEIRLTTLGPGFRFNPTWSPDSRHIAFTDKANGVWVVDVTFDGAGRHVAAATCAIDASPSGDGPDIGWSHDSSWLAYTRADEGNDNTCIWMYNLAQGEKTRLTSPYFAASSPAFDRRGEFLYYVASREFASPRYSDVDSTFIYAGNQRLMVVPLRKDVKSPLAPKSDEEEIKPASPRPAPKDGDKPREKDDKPANDKPGDDAPKDDKPKDDKHAGSTHAPVIHVDPPAPLAAAAVSAFAQPGLAHAAEAASSDKPLRIDLSGFEARAIQLPVRAGDFASLMVADEGKLIYIRRGSRGEDDKPSIKLLDPKDDKHEEQTVADGAGSFAMSANGKKLLVSRPGNKAQLLDAAPGGGKAQDISTAAMKKAIDPRAEWKQLLTDAWRLERDFFYVPNMHGVDWPRVREQAADMLADAASREDVQYILGEMISQLNIGHAYLGGPGDLDQNAPAGAGVGLLACDFDLKREPATGALGYRFRKVYHGAAWDAEARGPLAQSEPEKDRVVEGEYLLAVNGVPVDTAKDPWAALAGLADRAAVLTVNTTPLTDGAQRDVLVTPVASDQQVRFRAWIEANRAQVERAGDGKVGYIYVPNTGAEGQNELFRQFYAQRARAALIIDDRWNGGGQIPDRFIELLNRPVTNYWARRDGKDSTSPPDAHNGPKCMLINGLAGSGGDMFPWLFKDLHLGKLVGQRTWGGLVGISGVPPLIDGGGVTVPSFGFYKKDGSWGIEGHGVDPDVPVIDDPGVMLDGGPAADPQLAAAVQLMLDEVRAHPYTPPSRPTPPDRSGMGIPERDR